MLHCREFDSCRCFLKIFSYHPRVLRRLFEDSAVCPWTYFCRTSTPAERSSGAGFYSDCEAKSFGNPLQSYELQQVVAVKQCSFAV
uniref:Uncharacterized protein n=1 Tax=Cyprinus carpio TaxID=7962 RepID=A0A8C2F7C4_CYPCA